MKPKKISEVNDDEDDVCDDVVYKINEGVVPCKVIYKVDEVDKLKNLVEDHWKYVNDICEKMYKDAFIHGYKHGQENKK